MRSNAHRLGLLLLLSCAHVTPQPPPSELSVDAAAQPVLDAWAQALGGREALARFEVIHRQGRAIAAGLPATYESWLTARGEERVVVSFDNGMGYARTYDGARGWFRDSNNEVRELAGAELDDVAESVFLEANAALLPGRQAGRVSMAEGGVLLLRPRASRHPMEVRFDAATHLPSSVARHDGAALEVTQFSDWRVVDGVRVPFVTALGKGRLEVTLSTLDHQPPPPHAFERPPDGAPDFTFDSPSPVTVPVKLEDGVLFVPVEIAGHTLHFILDSGATSIVIDQARAAELGLTGAGSIDAHTVAGDKAAGFIRGVTTKIGGLTLHGQTVATLPLAFVSNDPNARVDGVLGYELFSRVVVEIDYRRQQVRFFERDTYHHDGEPIALQLDASVAHAVFGIELDRGDLDDGLFKVDTGQTEGLALSSPFVLAHPRLVLGAWVRALRAGPVRVESPPFSLSRATQGPRADPDVLGIIGGGVLSQFQVVFDYRHRKLWLDPPR